MKAFDKV